MKGPFRRTFVGVAALVIAGVSALVATTLTRGDSPTANGAEAPVILFTRSAELPTIAEFTGSERVSSLDELKRRIAQGPAVVVVDQEATTNMAATDLAFVFENGSAVMGLNVPLDRLNEITGFRDVIGALNTKFGESTAKPATFDGQFFSLVWTTTPGQQPAYWSRLQHELQPRELSVILSDYRLRVVGLIREDGRVVPLEDYGKASDGE